MKPKKRNPQDPTLAVNALKKAILSLNERLQKLELWSWRVAGEYDQLGIDLRPAPIRSYDFSDLELADKGIKATKRRAKK